MSNLACITQYAQYLYEIKCISRADVNVQREIWFWVKRIIVFRYDVIRVICDEDVENDKICLESNVIKLYTQNCYTKIEKTQNVKMGLPLPCALRSITFYNKIKLFGNDS